MGPRCISRQVQFAYVGEENKPHIRPVAQELGMTCSPDWRIVPKMTSSNPGPSGQPHKSVRHPIRTATGFVLSALVGLVLGVVFEEPLIVAKNWVGWHAEHRRLTGSPDCTDTGWLREVVPTDTAAYSQYREKSNSSIIYLSRYTTDNERETAWVAPLTGDIKKDWIAWDLRDELEVEMLCLRPGFTRDYATYAGNGRPREIDVVACGASKSVNLTDQVDLETSAFREGFGLGDWVAVPLRCETSNIRIEIKSAFPAYDESELVAISDVRILH